MELDSDHRGRVLTCHRGFKMHRGHAGVRRHWLLWIIVPIGVVCCSEF